MSQNPATAEVYQEYTELTPEQIEQKIALSHSARTLWKKKSIQDREKLMQKFADVIREKRDVLANLITIEMGCPIGQAQAEVEKCAVIADHFARETHTFLQSTPVEISGAKEAYIAYEPLGTLLHIAPWNYPMYLALRPAIPALMAGNTVLMKHASNVPQCSLALEALFIEAGFEPGVFQSLLVGGKNVEPIIHDDRISIVTLIGSEYAGSQVAAAAGKALKKTIMELGGADPFIVLADANIDKAVEGAVVSRLRNCGQSCNAAKRFIVVDDVIDEFTDKLKVAFEKETIGDPSHKQTTLGPLATQGGLADIQRQVSESISHGAILITGGEAVADNDGYYFEPTILRHIRKGMPVYHEEVFGPVAPVISVKDADEAIATANDSHLGLGASLWTENYDLARSLISQIESGNVYINSIVRGDPRLPYGGVKKSGYGREFGEIGIKELVNIKSVVIR